MTTTIATTAATITHSQAPSVAYSQANAASPSRPTTNRPTPEPDGRLDTHTGPTRVPTLTLDLMGQV